MKWTGPRREDMNQARTRLIVVVPPERWPHGPPEEHEGWCFLHMGGLYCDCCMSRAEDDAEDGGGG